MGFYARERASEKESLPAGLGRNTGGEMDKQRDGEQNQDKRWDRQKAEHRHAGTQVTGNPTDQELPCGRLIGDRNQALFASQVGLRHGRHT